MRNEDDMRNRFAIHKIVTNKRFMPFLLLGILLCALCMGSAGMAALAKASDSDFAIDASLLASTGNTYDISLTASNMGGDWEGTLRLLVANSYGWNCTAYDTVLALPSGSIKQFVVKIPKDSVDTAEAAIRAVFLDKHSKVAAEVELKQFRWNETDVLAMGILSDDYSALTYLDMGGTKLYYYGNNYPIRLMELSQDSLETSLDSLVFLVIDNYNTGILSEETIGAIEDWVLNGGVLIVGTGNRAKEVLGGLGNLGITCDKVYAPGEDVEDVWQDWETQLAIAELKDEKFQYGLSSNGNLMLMSSRGNGAVGVLPYALSDFGRLREDAYGYTTQEDEVWWVLEAVSSEASAKYVSQGSTGTNYSRYFFRGVFGAMGFGDSRLNFGALKILVVLYVIFAGPVLYVILRVSKKRELYWLAVPAAALVGIFLVSLAGRGFEVRNTRVYSVTVSDLTRPNNTQTYLRCYDVGHNEWNLRLAEGYESIGPMKAVSNYSNHDKEYYYHVKKEGERLFFGIDPEAGFEDSYFLTGNVAHAEIGSLELSNLSMPDASTGTVSNNTDWDFSYIALIAQNHLTVYKGLSAGEIRNLEDLEVAYATTWGRTISGGFASDVLDVAARHNKKDVELLAALGLGIYQAYPEENTDAVIVLGVTKDWEKTVDDDCREISFGCLYQIQ